MESDSSIYRFLPFFNKVFNDMKETCDEIFQFLRKQIEQNKRELELKDDEEPATDYVEAFLKQQKKLTNEGCTDHFFE